MAQGYLSVAAVLVLAACAVSAQVVNPTGSTGNLTQDFANGNWTFPADPPNCAGLEVDDQGAGIFIYCEKTIHPDQVYIYERKFEHITEITRGEIPNNDPNLNLYPPEPGVLSYVSIQDKTDPTYIRELQYFASSRAFLQHYAGPSGNPIFAARLNMAWFSCWYFGNYSQVGFAVEPFKDTLISLGNTNRSWTPNIWPFDNPSVKSGFVINKKVDLKTPPNKQTGLPPCPVPALNMMTKKLQAAPVSLVMNITSIPFSGSGPLNDTQALADYLMNRFPCVMTFATAMDPALSTPEAGKFMAVSYFSNFKCLEMAVLSPETKTGKKLSQRWASKFSTMDIRVFGVLEPAQQNSIPRLLKRLNPALNRDGSIRFNYLLGEPRDNLMNAGHIINNLMNVNGVALVAAQGIK